MVWSAIEFFAYPTLLLAITPVLIRELGVEQFGVWIFITTVAAIGGVVTLGMAPATTRFVSVGIAHAGKIAPDRVIATTLLITCVGASAYALITFAAAPILTAGAIHTSRTDAEGVETVRFAGLLTLVQQVDLLFAAALKGMERFRTAALLELGSKLIALLAMVGAVLAFSTLNALLVAAILGTLAGALTKGLTVCKVSSWSIQTSIAGPTDLKEIAIFGLWTSVHGLGGLLFQHLDRVLLLLFLGPGALTIFVVALQFCQLIHALPAAALSVLLPRMSQMTIANSGAVASATRRAYRFNAAIVALIALPILGFSESLLDIWLDGAFTTNDQYFMIALGAAYVILGLNVAPHYILLAFGKARYVSALSLLSALAAAAGTVILIPMLGLLGAASSRGMYATFISVNYLRVRRELRT
jgi:O-antigen/teichoic acid export membrane protein